MKIRSLAGTILSVTLSSFVLAEVPEGGASSLVAGNRSFALALHQQLAGEGKTLFYSPYSISTAMAMTYAGAAGETESQMKSALHFPGNGPEIAPQFGELQDALSAAQLSGVELRVANSLWPHLAFAVKPEFIELVERNFRSDIYLVDYAQPEAARERINAWVLEKTRDKINDLIPAGALTPLTRMVLANAIYFKGMWASPFDPALTESLPFFPEGQTETTTDMMRGELNAAYGATDDCQLLELAYAGDTLSMLIVLPVRDMALSSIESKISPELLTSWEQSLSRQKVKITLPKFKLTSEFSLSSVLAALGMGHAFDPANADFSGIDGQPGNLVISDVFHKAFVDVNEEGTEAAAATAVVMRTTSMREPPPVPEFRADRPFLFFINERSTGSILFVGRYAAPPQS